MPTYCTSTSAYYTTTNNPIPTPKQKFVVNDIVVYGGKSFRITECMYSLTKECWLYNLLGKHQIIYVPEYSLEPVDFTVEI